MCAFSTSCVEVLAGTGTGTASCGCPVAFFYFLGRVTPCFCWIARHVCPPGPSPSWLFIVGVAFGWSWANCGTRYDRLIISTLDFSADPGLQAGAEGTITITGTTDLHVPLITGAWQIRLYELGQAHQLNYTDFGDLTSALHFTDPLNTTFVMNVGFTLQPIIAGSGNNFTAALSADDQAKGEYLCAEINYALN